MKRREFIGAIGFTFAWPLAAQEQPATMPVIGFLSTRSPDDSSYLLAAFRQSLAEHGYIEGRSLAVEYRWAEGRYDRLAGMAADLASRDVAVIVAVGGEPAALAAKAATSNIPIVFGIGGDPVTLGLAASLNHPGGNATGVSLLTSLLEAKRLGLLRQLKPDAVLVAVLIDPKFAQAEAQLNEVEQAASGIGQRIEVLKASNEPELEAALATIAIHRADALLVASDPFFDTQRARIIAAARQNRVPAIYQFREYAVAGGLMSYGISLTDAYRQFGAYTARILRGAKPADLPVQQSIKFELVFNLQTAKALDLTIPPSLLAVADEVIE